MHPNTFKNPDDISETVRGQGQSDHNFSSSSRHGVKSLCHLVKLPSIHSKSWFRWFSETAENFEFPAERLSEKTKTVNFSMCVRNETKFMTNIITNYCQLSSIITNYYQNY